MKPSSRKRIPAALRAKVWNTYIGEERGVFQCMCNSYVSQLNFECGHVIPVAQNGPTTLENLRPLCTRCNRSMGDNHMFEYMLHIGVEPEDLYWNAYGPSGTSKLDRPSRSLAIYRPQVSQSWLAYMGRGVWWTLKTSWWLVGKLVSSSGRDKKK